MTVSGARWQKLTLGKLIPALDPDDPSSLASKIVKETDRISGQITTNVSKVENITRSVSDTLKTVSALGNQIAELQKSIDELIGNAVNTGVYMHLLGLNPIFSDTQPLDVINELRSVFFQELDDNNRPQFRGSTAFVGGVLLIITAPNINEMIASVQRLAIVFPAFKNAIGTITTEATEVKDLVINPFNDLKTDISQLASKFTEFNRFAVTGKAFTDLFGQATDPFALTTNPEGTASTPAYDRWFALRVSDLIPDLNPNLPGSAASIVVGAERDIVNGGIGLLQQAEGLSNGVNQLANAVNLANRQLQKLATNVTELVTSLGNTGLYIHTIGLDGSVTNSQEFVDACGRSLLDLTDKDRPRAAGEMMAFAGMVVVFGAANPLGLSTQFASIGGVFGGLETNIKSIGQAAKF
jgi:uncharacterized protein YoxC